MALTKRLQGVCPILPTPFLEDNTIDVQGLRKEVNFLIKAGVTGIALFGNASEAFALTKAEKQLIADTVVAQNRGRVLWSSAPAALLPNLPSKTACGLRKTVPTF